MEGSVGRKASPIGRYLFEDAPPPPAHLPGLARPFVDRAKLGYRNFRVEHEKIGSAVIKAMEQGLIGPDDASLLWLDTGGITAQLLIARYCDARQYAPVDAWIRARPGFQTANWLNGYVRFALDRFVADGEGPRAATLALAHVERVMKSLRLDWKERRRTPPKKLPAETQAAIRSIQRALIERIPQRNAEMLLELAEVGPYLEHGTADERAALAALRDEIRADEQRFPAS